MGQSSQGFQNATYTSLSVSLSELAVKGLLVFGSWAFFPSNLLKKDIVAPHVPTPVMDKRLDKWAFTQ